MRELVVRARVGRLATVGSDGRPHIVPVCFVVLGETVAGDTPSVSGDTPSASGDTISVAGDTSSIARDTIYTAVDDKPKRFRDLRRTANIRATGVACLLVDHYDEDWSQLWWVRLDGRARVVDDRAEAARAAEALRAKYPQYDRPPAGPVLALDVERWRGWSARR